MSVRNRLRRHPAKQRPAEHPLGVLQLLPNHTEQFHGSLPLVEARIVAITSASAVRASFEGPGCFLTDGR